MSCAVFHSLFGFEQHVGLDLVEADRVGGHLGAPGARHDRARLGEARQHLFGLLAQAHRLLQADRREPLDVEGKRALVDARHELGAEAGGDRRRQQQRATDGGEQRQRPRHHALEQRAIARRQPLEHARLAAVLRHAQKVRARRRERRQREDERAAERHGDRDRHRLEHAPLGAFERHQRQVHEQDDGDGEAHRLGRLPHRLGDDVGDLLARWSSSLERGHRRLEHDDGAVDEQTEVDGAERHEVAGDAAEHHADDGHAHRQRNGERREHAAAQGAERGEEHEHDQERAFGQVHRDGVQRAIDELGAIVVGHDAHAGRQVALDLRQLDLDVLHHLARVLPDQHHHGAGDDLALAVLGDDAVAQRGAELDVGDLAQQHRRAVVVDADGGAGDVLERLELRFAAEHDLLVALLDVAAADVAVVLLEHVEDLGERQVVLGEPLGIDDHLVLLGLAAHGVDLDDAGHGAQLPRHVPIEQRAQLHRRVAIALEVELVDLAEARRHRRQLGAAVGGRDVGFGHLEPLGDELPRQPDVHLVVEDDGDGADGGARDRPDLGQLGQAVHGHLDGEREVRLHLRRRQAGRAGDDGDLHVGDVGDGVDRQLAQGGERGGDDDGADHEHHAAAPHRPGDERAEAGQRSSSLLSRNAPSVTTGSPSATPRTISTSSPPETPTSTARCSN